MLLLGVANGNRKCNLGYPHSPEYPSPAANPALNMVKMSFLFDSNNIPKHHYGFINNILKHHYALLRCSDKKLRTKQKKKSFFVDEESFFRSVHILYHT